MTPIKLDIISDPICPWCYIGKTELDRALEANPDHPFLIEWHPFQLNPKMPADGMDRVEYLELKFGGKQGAAQSYAPILERAEKLGLNIDFAGIKRTPNTMDAHRLIHWAGLEGRQTPVVSALFRAYFNEGRDIGDPEVLADIGAAMGMDRDLVAKLLAGDADRDDITSRDIHSRKMGVQSVPTFIVGNKHAVIGAQSRELWEDVIAELRQNTEAET